MDRNRAALAGCLLVAWGCASSVPEQPNIVFILADDLGYGHLGADGQAQIRTPALDRIAAEGVRFTQFYAGSTVCAPSRSVLMTGRHTGHTSTTAACRLRATRTAPDGLDGLSMVPVLVGPERTGREAPTHEYLYWEYGNVRGEAPVRQAARWGDWNGVRADLGAPLELYDLAADVGETTDMAGPHPDVVRQIAAYLDTARVAVRAYPPEVTSYRYAGPAPGPDW